MPPAPGIRLCPSNIGSSRAPSSEGGGAFCDLLWKMVRPPRSEGFLFKGVANFLHPKVAKMFPPAPRALQNPGADPL